MKRFLNASLVLLFALTLSACAGIGSKIGTSPSGLELPIEKASLKLLDDAKDGGYKLVNTEELYKWTAEKKDMIIIDVLPKDEYDKGHIPGAVNSPLPKTEKELTPFDTESVVKTAGSDKEKPVVLYCGFVACRRSHLGAKILAENGFKSVNRYPAGITGWKEMGYPLEK
ncbi:rhodanese-like domain-containing protein [bacterium]|nr:MAG: rhodanese-like domain-containing protein [bacterium]